MGAGGYLNSFIQPIYDLFNTNPVIVDPLPISISMPTSKMQTGYIINNILANSRPNEAFDGNGPEVINMYSLKPKNSVEDFLYWRQLASMKKHSVPSFYVEPTTFGEFREIKKTYIPLSVSKRVTIEQLLSYCSTIKELQPYVPIPKKYLDLNVSNDVLKILLLRDIYPICEMLIELSNFDKNYTTHYLQSLNLRHNFLLSPKMLNVCEGEIKNNLFYIVQNLYENPRARSSNIFGYNEIAMLQILTDAALNISTIMSKGTEIEVDMMVNKLQFENRKELIFISKKFLMDINKMGCMEFRLSRANIPMETNGWFKKVPLKTHQLICDYISNVFRVHLKNATSYLN